MNVLIAGHGQGSFEIRGRQLGRAIGARVVSSLSDADLGWADVVVLVKRAIASADQVHRAGKPLVWDALDFWAQPEQNGLSEADAKQLLHDTIAHAKPSLVIGATESMADASSVIALPHHARPGLIAKPVAAQVKSVGYEGSRKYLGRWGRAIAKECVARGWAFVVNPRDLSDADLVVAFRDAEWDGWMCREWKSGVKVVNAMQAGRPIISQPCAAMRELHPAGTVITDVQQIPDVFGAWTSFHARLDAARQNLDSVHEYALSRIANRYRDILTEARQAQAA